MGVGGKRHVTAALPRERDPVPIVQEAGWASGQVLMGAKNLASTRIRFPGRPARIESLYRLSYPDPILCYVATDNAFNRTRRAVTFLE